MSKYRILESLQAQQDETDATDEAAGAPADGTWTRKSFVLAKDAPGAVYVPSPVAGHVHHVGDYGAVELYDSPGTDGRLLGRVLHMDPRSFAVSEGEAVDYGEPLGRQWGAGAGNAKTSPDHVEMELDAGQLQRYLEDIEAGVISPDVYPGMTKRLRRAGLAPLIKAKPSGLPIAVAIAALQAQRIVEAGDRGPGVIEIQTALHGLGYLDARGAPLRVDGVFGERTREALESFQREHGLRADGIAEAQTLSALHKAERQPLVSNPDHPDHALYRQALAGLEKLDAGTFASAEERRNAAAALVAEAKLRGMRQIDHVSLDAGGGSAVAIQGKPQEEEAQRIRMDLKPAGAQPLERSSLQLEQHKLSEEQRHLQEQTQKQIQTQELERRQDMQQQQRRDQERRDDAREQARQDARDRERDRDQRERDQERDQRSHRKGLFR
ncbi:peptidoglycan-binding domain-containing protein [Luteimonas aquatica]|uniref:peptidoglycan-binding domain-containing protein n=1 Tax=Luteimonas aquatica TaxID=450364 RepID=UPI001F57A247|nr:peptidoglycan-binding protein [Luteimonas aquatica]